MVYPCSGILLNHKKNEVLTNGQTLQTLCSVQEARKKRPLLYIYLYEMARVGKSKETENRFVVGRARIGGRRLPECGISFRG